MDPQLVELFGKVLEPLGGGTLLEEVHRWGQALSVFELVPLYFLMEQRLHGFGWKCDLLASRSCSHICSLLPCLRIKMDSRPFGTVNLSKFFHP